MRRWDLSRIRSIVVIVELYTRYVSTGVELLLFAVNSVLFSQVRFVICMTESIVWYPIYRYYWRFVEQCFILELGLIWCLLTYWRFTTWALAFLEGVDVVDYLVFFLYWMEWNALEIDATALSDHLFRTLVNVTNQRYDCIEILLYLDATRLRILNDSL